MADDVGGDVPRAEPGTMVITGGTGFLGVHACEWFHERGWDVTAFDVKPFAPGDEVAGVDYVEGDVRDEDAVRDTFAATDPDVVLHGAAALALRDEETIHDVGVTGTRNVLSAAVVEGVDRVVFTSSIVVYGKTADVPIAENHPLRAVGPYGAAKIDAETVCRSFRSDLCVPVLRPPSFVGPRRLGIFGVLFDWIESGASVPLIGSGRNRYQLLHVDDLLDAVELLLAVDEDVASDTFNVGADEFGTMHEDFRAPIEYAGTGKRTVGTPALPAVLVLRALDRLGLSPIYPWIYETAHTDYYLSVEKLKGLGWEPNYSNREALVDSYEWYVNEHDAGGNADGTASTGGSGFDHRVGWDQGALVTLKHLFKLL